MIFQERKIILFFNFKTFYWSVAELQGCVGFSCTESDSLTHVHIFIVFHILFSYGLSQKIE